MPSTSSDDATPGANEKKQLSFVYQPGVGLFDKKQTNSHERTQPLVLSSLSSDADQQCTSTNILSEPLQKSYLRRQNEQDPSPDDHTSDKTSHYHLIELCDENIPSNQENNQKRKFDRKFLSNKKLRSSPSHLQSNSEHVSDQPTRTNSPEKQQPNTDRPRSKSKERLAKQPITTIIKNIPMVKKLSTDNYKETPSQGLLLCPKDEQTPTKKKKKKISSTIASNTELLDDDSVLDSILFNDMQSVQQQWQQFLILTMEKELHVQPSDGKKKSKTKKFHRTNHFLLAYESLYDFEGMKHWHPTFRCT